ncbi:MAG TPA: hypothetical protein VK053_07995 [Jiangellaceae bacterium]|nr:hypothetical protein [Jiangellaceae bacterium]
MNTILPAMAPAQEEGWLALLELHERKPTGWTLVGGQMVHLHCAERGTVPARPTDDADTVLDVRAEPKVLYEFTKVLTAMGFDADGVTADGHQHRWKRGSASIDILIPASLGPRATARRGYRGGTTVSAPGAQQALDRTEDTPVTVAGITGTVRRPNLLGALVSKAAAHSVPQDPGKERHLLDFALLTTLIAPADMVGQAGERDRKRLRAAIDALRGSPRTMAKIEGSDIGLARLELALRRGTSA